MSAQYRINIEQHLVITDLWGECSDADIQNIYRALRADPGFAPNFDEILDLRRVHNFVAAGWNLTTGRVGVSMVSTALRASESPTERESDASRGRTDAQVIGDR